MRQMKDSGIEWVGEIPIDWEIKPIRALFSENLNKNFEGGRPSSIIIGDQVNPRSLGALLAHFENKVMFQGFLWNLNSFDQEGVQLGKVLAKRVLAHETDGALKVYSDLLNI